MSLSAAALFAEEPVPDWHPTMQVDAIPAMDVRMIFLSVVMVNDNK